jgi:hypothetical protein
MKTETLLEKNVLNEEAQTAVLYEEIEAVLFGQIKEARKKESLLGLIDKLTKLESKKEKKPEDQSDIKLSKEVKEMRATGAKMWLWIARNYEKLQTVFPNDKYLTTFANLSLKDQFSDLKTAKVMRMYGGLPKILESSRLFETILKITDKNNAVKSHNSIIDKINRREGKSENVNDLVRGTIMKTEGYKSVDEIWQEYQKIKIALPHKARISEFKPKLKAGGYSDFTIKIEIDGYPPIEIQFNTLECILVKKLESKNYELKREISLSIQNLIGSNMNGRDFADCLQIWTRKNLYNDFNSSVDFGISNEIYSSFLNQLNKNSNNQNIELVEFNHNIFIDYIRTYEEVFINSYEMYQAINPIIKTVSDRDELSKRYKDEREREEKEKFGTLLNGLMAKYPSKV